jgi:hypothetical protein
METYFWVKVFDGARGYSFGPYPVFSVAAEILVEAPMIIAQLGGGDSTVCSLTEEVIINGSWTVINVKVETR